MDSLARTPPALAPRVAHAYANATPRQRLNLLNGMLGPVGPLALVTVADRAFADLLPDGRWHTARASMQDTQRFTSEQIYELALYLEQRNPAALARLADDVQ